MNPSLQIEAYHRPRDLMQAIEILSKYGKKAKVIAGGTDIFPQRAGVTRQDNVDHLVDITRLGLVYIKLENGHYRIGAATPLSMIGEYPSFSTGSYRVFSEAVDNHSTTTIRNRATVGGNLCQASAFADLSLPMLVLDAVLVTAGPDGKREIPIEDFFTGINCSALDPAEVLVEIRIPEVSGPTGTSFIKLRRQQTAVDMAVINIATLVTIDDGSFKTVRIALGGVGPIPFRAQKAESEMIGMEPADAARLKAAATAADTARPIDDIRATADYRKKNGGGLGPTIS